jgi:putative Mg2+ transporter-C (MgtC) family protein
MVASSTTGMISHLHLLARIASGAALGGVIGYERDRHGRPVGLRTHLLVAMASATFMVVSSQFAYYQHYGPGEQIEVDGSRIAASVVSGIGFLAGGVILRTGATIQGLTTAAGLWLVTAIGLCTGSGMYFEGVAVTTMGVIALTALRRFEDKNDLMIRRRISLVLSDEPDALARALAALQALGALVSDVDYDRKLGEKRRIQVTFDARLPTSVTVPELVARLEQQAGVRRVHVQFPT